MALSALRLRRALRPLSTVLSSTLSPASAAPSVCAPPELGLRSSSGSHRMVRSALFRSSTSLLDRRSDTGEGKIDPNEILFEGCDYNHWLITMDFPKDQNLTPEEMVETYVQTCAKVLGSREEAMKRIYACSTTTYTGFQVEMSEETSEKFRGLPGVVFILPDSYIDPINKQYGGDKYEMGKITPRPPPVQYGRQGRYGDRNRNYDRPRYDRQRDAVPGQGYQSYNPQRPSQAEGRNYGPQGNQFYDRQSSSQGDGVGYVPQQNYSPNRQQDGRPYDNYGSMQADRRNHSPYPQQNYNPTGPPSMQYNQQVPAQGYGENYAPQQNYNPYDRQNPAHGGDARNYAQAAQHNYYPGEQPGGVLYHQQGVSPGQGANQPPRQMYNPNGQPGNSQYGQQGHMSDRTGYYTGQNYGPPSGPGNETSSSARGRVFPQNSGEHQENVDIQQPHGSNQRQQ